MSNERKCVVLTSFTVADLASIGGRGGATVGRFIVGAGRKLTELIASCD